MKKLEEEELQALEDLKIAKARKLQESSSSSIDSSDHKLNDTDAKMLDDKEYRRRFMQVDGVVEKEETNEEIWARSLAQARKADIISR